MEEQNAIEVKNLHKSFKVYMDRSNNLKDFLIRFPVVLSMASICQYPSLINSVMTPPDGTDITG